MNILIVDNSLERMQSFRDKFPKDNLTMVYTSEGAISKIKQNSYDQLFLDMDLTGKVIQPWIDNPKSGYAVAKWLSENPSKAPNQVIIHSLNANASDDSAKLMRGAGIHVSLKPYYWKQ